LFKRGGQDILTITEAERLEEIQDWDLYSMPIPDQEDIDNPMYLKNMRDNYYRFHGVDNKYHPKHLYTQPIRPSFVDTRRINSMNPVLIDQHQRTQFNNPYDHQRFITPTPAYRTRESTSEEYADRLSSYPDKANVYLKPKPYPQDASKRGISQIDLMLSLR
jgi:hypothetical protein